MKSRTTNRSGFFYGGIIGLMILLFSSCQTVDVFEKNAVIPNNEWQRTYKPAVDFTITDTTALYNIYVTLRHSYAYKYNNIWLNISYTLPGDSLKQQKLDVMLADNARGQWLGTGMDDIYEVRRLITPQPVRFVKAGNCNFAIEQIMRDNPLNNILNAGIRVEKLAP